MTALGSLLAQLDMALQWIVVQLDMSAAFNNISWAAILTSLRRIRLPAPLTAACRLLPMARIYEFVDSNGIRTRWHCERGVPQGGVLSPWLFAAGTLPLHSLEALEVL